MIYSSVERQCQQCLFANDPSKYFLFFTTPSRRFCKDIFARRLHDAFKTFLRRFARRLQDVFEKRFANTSWRRLRRQKMLCCTNTNVCRDILLQSLKENMNIILNSMKINPGKLNLIFLRLFMTALLVNYWHDLYKIDQL